MKKKLTYSSSGVDYNDLDPIKRLAQTLAAGTVQQFSIAEVAESRGESAYVWEEKDSFRALVIEGLGTKNLVADEMKKITGKTYYDAIAQDTIAMIVNDLIVVGASPQVITAYFAVGDSKWFLDKQRSTDLLHGWAKACKTCNAVWGGGETPTLKNIINPETIELAGSAIGVIQPKKRLTLGSRLEPGDAILLLESNGIHANGLTLARTIATSAPEGYATRLSDGIMYGDALLRPTHLYSPYIQALFEAGVDIHYMVNITGHGWRKLMRASQPFRYVLETVPEVSPLFAFIQDHSNSDDTEMYGNFNMGAGFALYISEKDIPTAQKIATNYHFQSWYAGHIESGNKKVIIKPKNVVFLEESLQVR